MKCRVVYTRLFERQVSINQKKLDLFPVIRSLRCCVYGFFHHPRLLLLGVDDLFVCVCGSMQGFPYMKNRIFKYIYSICRQIVSSRLINELNVLLSFLPHSSHYLDSYVFLTALYLASMPPAY